MRSVEVRTPLSWARPLGFRLERMVIRISGALAMVTDGLCYVAIGCCSGRLGCIAKWIRMVPARCTELFCIRVANQVGTSPPRTLYRWRPLPNSVGPDLRPTLHVARPVVTNGAVQWPAELSIARSVITYDRYVLWVGAVHLTNLRYLLSECIYVELRL